MKVPYKRCPTSIDDITRRGRTEMVLRRVVFGHKNKFRDLKFSAPVKAWECVTGLRW